MEPPPMTGSSGRRRKAAPAVHPCRAALEDQLARLDRQIRALEAEEPSEGSPRERILRAMRSMRDERRL
jgi:hypothetical protein